MLCCVRVGEPYVCYLGMSRSLARRPGTKDCKILEKSLWLKGETWPNKTLLAEKSSAGPSLPPARREPGPAPSPTAAHSGSLSVAIQLVFLP